jgi:hypothetical protein
MVNPNRDEWLWAERVRNSHDRQIEEGVEKPVLSRWSAESGYGLGGNRFELLGELGLQLSTPEEGGPTYIAPIEPLEAQEA